MAKLSSSRLGHQATVELSNTPNSLPRAPILDWSSFVDIDTVQRPSIEDLPYRIATTSGRAAIYQALLQLRLPPGSVVLVPTYHCPTMIAPAVLAGLEIVFYALGPDGLPQLESIEPSVVHKARAILVAHYFGMAQSLSGIRKWCDEHAVALIEDCAHSLYGRAGERPIGAWGDFATASLSKFVPLPEAGLLASNYREISKPILMRQKLTAEIKGALDVLELSNRHGGFRGLNRTLNFIFWLKNSGRKARRAGNDIDAAVIDCMQNCDMKRIENAPLRISVRLNDLLPRGQNIEQRRQNFFDYSVAFQDVSGARPLYPSLPLEAVPYVFPLWVDDADRIYHETRRAQLPVFRWDRVWPGTPEIEGDFGNIWSRHILQLLCHQNLSKEDISMVANTIKGLL